MICVIYKELKGVGVVVPVMSPLIHQSGLYKSQMDANEGE